MWASGYKDNFSRWSELNSNPGLPHLTPTPPITDTEVIHISLLVVDRRPVKLPFSIHSSKNEKGKLHNQYANFKE